MKNNSTKYVSYRRVSTTEQGNTNLGLSSQSELIASYVGAENIVADFEEVASGTLPVEDRPKLSEAIQYCNDNGYTLITAKVDRLGRNILVSAEAVKMLDNKYFSCDCDNPEMLGLFYWFSERERNLISNRTELALKKVAQRTDEERKALGKKKIGREKGCDTTKAREESLRVRREARDAKLSEAISFASDLKETGKSLRQIAERLKKAGFTTSRGKDFTATAVRRLLVA